MSTEIQKKPSVKTIQGLLESDQFKMSVAKSLPKHLTSDRFIRVACTTLMRTPKLAECDQTSFFNALLTLSQYGLEPDGRRAHLIPFKNSRRNCYEVQLIIDWKGLAELAMRSGLVSTIFCDVVCENDSFEYDRGEITAHKINFRQDRGNMFAVYCLVKMRDGSVTSDVMQLQEVLAIRDRSKSKDSGPWVTDFREMAKKTVFRRLSKRLTLSPEFRDAVEVDDDSEEERARNAKPVAGIVSQFTIPNQEPPQVTEPEQDDVLWGDSARQEADEIPANRTEKTQAPKEATKTNEPKTSEVETMRAFLARRVTEEGFSFDQFHKLADSMGWLEGKEFTAFDEIPEDLALRLSKGIRGIITALKGAK